MAPNALPARPNLEQLRKLAKELLRAARNEDPLARARLQAQIHGHTGQWKLADALRAIAREYGFSSWANLRAHVENVRAATVPAALALPTAATTHRPRRRGPRRTPGRAEIQALHTAVVAAARQGDPYPFIFAPPIGPFRTAVQAPLREALVESNDLSLVIDVLLRGATHSNPKVRAECAHAMDWLADDRCLAALRALAEDPVPRVRWFALHSLACDDCKLTPLPACPDVVSLLVSKAESDPSERVRRRAAETLQLVAGQQIDLQRECGFAARGRLRGGGGEA